MAIPLNVNGTVWLYPEVEDIDWGVQATGWAAAVTAGLVPKNGGTFLLTNPVSFGPLAGISALNFSTVSTTPATTGVVRLSATDTIAWRNAVDTADNVLSVDGSDNLLFNGQPIGSFVLYPTETNVDATTDFVAFYDSSAAAYRKATVNNLIANATISGGTF